MILRTCWRCSHVCQNRLILQPRSPYPLTNAPSVPTTRLHGPNVINSVPVLNQQRSPFTTTTTRLKNPHAPKSKTSLQSTKGTTTLRLNKKARPVKTGKPSAGNRKAKRKTLVLSNPLANQVSMANLTAEDASNPHSDGTLCTFEGDLISRLRFLEGFRLKQCWNLFYAPATLIRAESIEIGSLIAWMNAEKGIEPGIGAYELEKQDIQVNEWSKTESPWEKLASESRSVTRVIHGPKGSGKSILLLQAMAWAILRDWVVITIPDTQDLVIGHTEYEYDPSSNRWIQRQYTADLLKRILSGNSSVLRRVPLSRAYNFIREDKYLIHLVELGANDATISWEVFNTLLGELALPGRPPVLFTLDNLNQISLPTRYRDPSFKFIHAHDLAIPATFLDYLTGMRSFWRGVILAATCSNSHRAEALEYALRGETPPPYERIDPRIAPSIEGAPVLNLSPLTREQAKKLMGYYQESGLYTQDVNATLAEKYVLSSGNPKELLTSCVRLRC